MKWLVGLYPGWWRARYGPEFREVLDGQPASLGMFLDVLGGAVDAHLHPRLRIGDSNGNQGEKTMAMITGAMLARCEAGGPKLSHEDRRKAQFYMRVSVLGLALLYLVLTKIFRSAIAVQALGFAAFPAAYLVYQQTAYLRGRSRRAQALVLVSWASGMYLFMLGVCWIAQRI